MGMRGQLQAPATLSPVNIKSGRSWEDKNLSCPESNQGSFVDEIQNLVVFSKKSFFFCDDYLLHKTIHYNMFRPTGSSSGNKQKVRNTWKINWDSQLYKKK
jgi:hypothetical protein